jgi:signal transduction histidine kinase
MSRRPSRPRSPGSRSGLKAPAARPARPSTPDCAQLLTLVVHELRTPLGVVSGYLKMLERDPDALGERQRKIVREAERSCSRLVALVSEISELSRLESGSVTFAREKVDLLDLLREVADQVKLASPMHELSDREVSLEIRGDDACALIGDPARLNHAFAAIFQAVLREQPRAGTVVVEVRRRASEQGESAIIVVAPQVSVQISYESAAAPFDEGRGGLGVALPLARRVIERHGGRIWAPAEGPERGAAVISLPLSELRP